MVPYVMMYNDLRLIVHTLLIGRSHMDRTIIEDADQLASPRRIFTFLILYRWLSLIPPLLTLRQTHLGLLATQRAVEEIRHEPQHRHVAVRPVALSLEAVEARPSSASRSRAPSRSTTPVWTWVSGGPPV